VVWEVYLGLPPNTAASNESPNFLGTISLFSAGVRSHSHGEFKPEHFSFPATKALAVAMRSKQSKPQLTFVPTGPLIDGKPSQPKIQSPVRIGSVNISIAKQEEQKEGQR
jgi:hypothetical protein